MMKLWTRFFGNDCEHLRTLTVRSVGVERTVCEQCGNVSFSIAPNLVMTDELVIALEKDAELPRVAGL
ncbi:MAG: hypothetical protein WBM90_01385 [Acidimicrobiia bacterium]